MAISFPVIMPSTPGFTNTRFGLSANTGVFESPLTRTQQVVQRAGSRWMVTYSLPPMNRASAAAWAGFLASLRGMRGTFRGFDPDAKTPRGIISSSAIVGAASQTGNTLSISIASASTTAPSFRIGDFIAITAPTQRLHMIVEDATATSTGGATLSIEPELRESPTAASTITYTNPYTSFRLAGNDVGWDASNISLYGITFSAIEAL